MQHVKTQFVSDLKEGSTVDSIFAVRSKSTPTPYRDGKTGSWFSLHLADRTGAIEARFWGNDREKTKGIWESFQKGDVVRIRGKVVTYNESLQVSISEPITEVSQYSIDDFLPRSKRNPLEMITELKGHLSTIQDPYISALVDRFLEDSEFMERFSHWPAAMSRHQNYLGGLLEHTLNLIRLSIAVVQNYPELDGDLIIAGCFLRDIGKIREYEVSTTITFSEEGRLIGHISIGQQMVEEKVSQIEGFPEELRLRLIHVILSHHGRMEWGSPKEPEFPEAMAVHLVDQMDAQLGNMKN